MLSVGDFVMHRFGFDADRRERVSHEAPQPRRHHVRRLVKIAGAVLRPGRDELPLFPRLEEEELHLRTGIVHESHRFRHPEHTREDRPRVSDEWLTIRSVDVADQPGGDLVLNEPGEQGKR